MNSLILGEDPQEKFLFDVSIRNNYVSTEQLVHFCLLVIVKFELYNDSLFTLTVSNFRGFYLNLTFKKGIGLNDISSYNNFATDYF